MGCGRRCVTRRYVLREVSRGCVTLVFSRPKKGYAVKRTCGSGVARLAIDPRIGGVALG